MTRTTWSFVMSATSNKLAVDRLFASEGLFRIWLQKFEITRIRTLQHRISIHLVYCCGNCGMDNLSKVRNLFQGIFYNRLFKTSFRDLYNPV